MRHTNYTGIRLVATKGGKALASPLAVLCPSVASAVAVLAMLCIAFFVMPFSAHAAIFTSGSTYTGSGVPNSPALIGSFVPTVDTVIDSSVPLFLEYKNTSGFPTCVTGQYIQISESSTSSVNSIDRQLFTTSTTSTDFIPYDGTFNGTKNLTAGNTYYVRAYSQCNPGNFEVKNVRIGEQTNPGDLLNSFYFSDTYETRFITGTVSGPKNAVVFNVTYFMKLLEFTANNRPDYVNISISKDITNDVQVDSFDNLLLFTEGTSTRNFTSGYSHTAGDYVAYVTFKNKQTQNVTFNKTTLVLHYTVDSSNVTAYTVSSITNGTSNNEQTQYEKCNILDVGCGIRNAFKFLFAPSTDALTDFTETYNELWTKAPFVYLNEIPTIIEELTPGSTTNFSIGLTTAMGAVVFFDTNTMENMPYKSTIRLMIEYALWLGFAFLIYRKAINIHEKQT